MDNSNIDDDEVEESIAIIGLSGRFPGAKNLEEFWQNLKNGVESISFFSDQELVSSGIEPSVLTAPNYVKAKGVLDNVADFDAAFFGLSPKEAQITDPQQRLFLECAWEALEQAGYNSKTYSGLIGVYGGVGGNNTYLSNNLSTNPQIKKTVDDYQILIGNDKDFLCTRVSYKLNLSGPSITVQTACSTSLVAVVMGCRSLLTYQCDMVLAGGAAISLPEKSGYFYREGMILSPDGHCRAFDAKAQGIVTGNGVGIVVLKRLEDALADGDYIHALIKAAAINNDGALKVGFTAPSVDAQALVIAEALELAEISADTISYVEAHGTGTSLGDPIEIAALTKAFHAKTDKKGYCAIGSVKTNIGHLDAAAGIAGLIKTVLALKHQLIPPSLHFETANPKLDLANSPFYVNTKLSEWKGYPRRAGVSSFGMGGTNAHVILEEAPPFQQVSPLGPRGILLLLSAKTGTALETATTQLVEHLKQHPELNLADVAYTYQVGRRAFSRRRMLVCQTLEEAVTALETRNAQRVFTQVFKDEKEPTIVFMFSGQGAQYVNMGLGLYQTEPVFREQVDRCAEFLKPLMGLDLRTVLLPANAPLLKEAEPNSPKENVERPPLKELTQTAITQPALFVIEYALAQLWMRWGVRPQAMIGHSIGEYVAACLAGVFSLEEALTLVAARGRLMQTSPPGAMLAVPLSEEEIRPLLTQNLDLAAINGPSQCVVSGTTAAVAQFAAQFAKQGLECQRLQTSHAFHSEMMSPILISFLEQVQQLQLNSPQIPFLSNVTGTWISAAEATSPYYWAKHIRQPVRFAAGLQTLLTEPSHILLEIGPGHTLSRFAKRHPDNAGQLVLSSLRHPKAEQSDNAFLLNTLGKLWMAGVVVNWSGFYADERRYRLPLPTYPFERQRYWVEPPAETIKPQYDDMLRKKPEIADWFYVPSWKRTAPPIHTGNALIEPSGWLVFMDECGLASQLVTRLEQHGQNVITVKLGEQLTRQNAHRYSLNPQQHDDYDALFKELQTQNNLPTTIIHFWNVTTETESGADIIDSVLNLGFYSLLFIAQTLGKQNITHSVQIWAVSNQLQAVTGNEVLCPEKATLLGTAKVIPQEYPNISCRNIDIVFPEAETSVQETLVDQLLSEFVAEQSDSTIIAYRDTHRWVQTFEPVRLEQTNQTPRLTEKGVYLITGGLGGIGLVLAEYLAKTVQAKLILTMRSAFPEKEEWAQWLATHPEPDSISRHIRKLQALEALGAEVLIVRADVANAEQMSAVLTQSLAQFGQIHGVIHTAGVPGGGVIQRKTRETADRILAPKVIGTRVLEAVFKEVQLELLVLCSSLTSILGGFGQVDYCAANAFLDAFAHYKKANDGTFTVSINWDGWQQVGMAASAAKQHAGTLKIPQPPRYQKVAHPLFDKCLVEETEQAIYITQLSTQTHWVLDEHKVMGKPTLPGTAYLEMARAAFENHANNDTIENHANHDAIELKEVYFIAPLTVEPCEEKEVRTRLTKQENGFDFVIMSQSNSGEDSWQEHARGQIAGRQAERPDKYVWGLKTAEVLQTEAVFHELETAEALQTSEVCHIFPAGFIEVGPRWHNLKQIKLGPRPHQGWAVLKLPDAFFAELNTYKLHPALLDVATSFTVVKQEGAYLPFSYKRLLIKGPLPTKVYSYIISQEENQSNTLRFDIIIMDEQGNGLVEIEDYTLRRIDGRPDNREKPFPISENFQLEITSPGFLETLKFRPATRHKLGPGEVEIEVAATGLNFKEVLLALGILQVQSQAPVPLGLECAGQIVALGEGVKDLKIGDEVMAFASACFSAYTTTSAGCVAPKPQQLSLEEAATIPVAFTTAYYALHHLGRLCRGERVLIHAAAGGVGLAALQIAQLKGAEIFATAGSPEKRAFLQSLGIKHVMDSRTLAFADEVMTATNGQGVDVVLNSLGGEFIPKSLSVLAPFGRFLEIGKRDIYDNSQLSLRPFEKSLSFFAIDVGPASPQFSSLFSEVIQLFNEKKLSPLPYRVFPITEVTSAFEYMARAKHIGKIVVSLQDKEALKTVASEMLTTRHPERIHKPVDLARHETPATADINILQKDLKEGLLPAEGIEVFNRILRHPQPQMIVSTQDLEALLAKNTAATLLNSLTDSAPAPLSQSTHQRPQLSHVYVAPRDELERRITEVWEKFLGIERVGIHDDFFELGGDSLMAVQLMSELRKTLSVKLSAHSLLDKPTIATLAEAIKPMSADTNKAMAQVLQSTTLVEIQAGNKQRQPLFLVHPAGGHVYFYRDLAHYLESEQPIYGFQAQGVDGETQPLTQIEAMAAHYIKALRVVQSEGPIVLGEPLLEALWPLRWANNFMPKAKKSPC
jgi:acyl transferase domain-containing protein/acyl carrier protein